jgi:hypothetical protein
LILWRGATEQTAEARQRTGILAARSKAMIVMPESELCGRRFFAVIEEHVHRNFQCVGEFFERYNRGHRVAVLATADVAANQASLLFDVALGHPLRFANCLQPIPDNHGKRVYALVVRQSTMGSVIFLDARFAHGKTKK